MARFAQKHTTSFDPQAVDSYQHGYSFSTSTYKHISKPGLSENVVREISHIKEEPEWMLQLRLKAYERFMAKPMPNFGADLSAIDYDKIRYYLRPTDIASKSWDDVPPEVKKTFDRLGIPEAEKQVLAGVKAQYDCLTADSLVFTTKGPKPIKNIKPGEKVYALNELSKEFEEQKVLGLAEKGKRSIFLVKTQGGRSIKVTKNHPFYSLIYLKETNKKRGNYSTRWQYLSDLKVGNLIAVSTNLPEMGLPFVLPKTEFLPTQRHSAVTIPHMSSEELAWLLGFYIGDGCFGGKTPKGIFGRIELAIPESDTQLRNEVSRITDLLFNLPLITREKDRVILGSQQLVAFFQALGVSGNAYSKRVPDWIYSLPKSQRLAFLGGYFDADGNIRKADTHRNAILTSVSYELLNDIKMLALYSGLNTSHIWKVKSNYSYNGQKKVIHFFRLSLSGDVFELGSRLARKKVLLTKRKYTHSFNSVSGSVFRKHVSHSLGFAKITSIEVLPAEEVFDIEVEGFHNFIANGLIVHNSEVVYGSLQNIWAKDGVVFLSMDEGLKQYPDLVKEYFGTIIPSGDNKFSALNTATWSGGSFVYIPKGVDVKMPLQAYFRINAPNAGQFERTLIIVDEGASVHYVEGCTAPSFTTGSLHSAVVEIFVKKGARCQYTTIQNWYKNVYNLVTKRAHVAEEAQMIWTDFNMGSKVTMKYPSFILAGKGAKGETLSMALAGEGQHQDTGSKAIHLAPHTSSTIISKSISKDGGRTSYRGMVNVGPHAHHSQNTVICDALLLDDKSRSDTYPVDRIFNSHVAIQHEATVSKIGDDQLFYLMSRGITEENARKLIVNGFIDDLVRKLPLEYAVEMNRLIEYEMEGSIG